MSNTTTHLIKLLFKQAQIATCALGTVIGGPFLAIGVRDSLNHSGLFLSNMALIGLGVGALSAAAGAGLSLWRGRRRQPNTYSPR